MFKDQQCTTTIGRTSHAAFASRETYGSKNRRGEIAAVGWIPDGDHGPVLLIPCDHDQNGDIDGQNGSGCQNLVIHAHPRLDRTAVRKRSVPQFIPSRPQLPWRNWFVKSCCGDG
jgi:hypothetical protein